MSETEAQRPFYANHRKLSAEECLVLSIFDEHKGMDPLKHSSAEKRIIPIPYNEAFLMESGYLVAGTSAGKRPIKGTARITSEGRQALRHHIGPALKELAKRKADKDIPERQREIFDELAERLEEIKKRLDIDEEEITPEEVSVRSLPPVKRRDASGKRIPLSKAVAAAGKGEEDDEASKRPARASDSSKPASGSKKATPAPARPATPVAAGAGKPPTRRR